MFSEFCNFAHVEILKGYQAPIHYNFTNKGVITGKMDMKLKVANMD